MKLGLIIDIQHAGRASRPGDLGASADLDGDGKIEPEEFEARLTPIYGMSARAKAEAGGVQVLWLEGGEYGWRHKAAIECAKAQPDRRWLYVACHLNAGGGNYGLVIADARSKAGQSAARHVADALGALPELREPRGRVVTGTTAAEGSAWPRAWSTIDGIFAGPANLSGICFEPCFIDRLEHRPLLTAEGLERIGAALVAGAMAWAVSP
jgi:hypothetical protein